MVQVLSALVVVCAFICIDAQRKVGDPCDVGNPEENTGSYGPHPSDCTKYIQCLHGFYGERECSPGLHWNKEEEACDWPQKANCVQFDSEQRNEVGGPCYVGDHKDNIGMYVAHPGDCTKYLQCLHGSFGERPCPDGLHWNSEKTACDWPQKANCNLGGVKKTILPSPPVQFV
ncbi:peritrophin-1-like [Bradysia coprophila]|uniref:peritrophin-1-like n=1 Tax=Bradysia coprophila TaxID=38358 RepID=UPI00187DDA66|nr:peritrophin-1-like [Bradysia coprophila]